MRQTAIITMSLPPKLVKEVGRAAKTQNMTRSELFRDALRKYMAELRLDEAVRIATEEKRSGKLRVLGRGGLAGLMSSK